MQVRYGLCSGNLHDQTWEYTLEHLFRYLLIILIVASCSPRGQVRLVPEATLIGEQRRVFIGTTRGRGESGALDGSRVDDLNFALYDVSIPPDRQRGDIKWPPKTGKVDPRSQFLTTREEIYANEAAFQRDLSLALGRNGGEAA